MYAGYPEQRPRWGRFLAVSFGLHAALAASLVASARFLTPSLPPEPVPIRVQLLRVAEPAAAAPVTPPVARVAPPIAAKPKPVVPRAVRRAPNPVAAKPLAPTPRAGPASSAAITAAPPSTTGSAIAGGVAVGSSSGLSSGRSAIRSEDELDAYIAQVRALIGKHKRYPALARRRGIEGRLVLSLAIAADGDVAVMHASGAASSLLEDGARAAVAAASPLPPPPAGALRLDVPVRFDLKE